MNSSLRSRAGALDSFHELRPVNPLTTMDAFSFMALVTVCAPLVHPTTARALVHTESGFNVYAIGIVGGTLQRQPRTLEEAVATAQRLREQGRNFSVGLGQINMHNFRRLNLSLADGFDACRNLSAMQSVLADCYARANSKGDPQPALRSALSCYYSGNFTTGFRHGYVRRVVSSAQQTARAPP